MIDLAGKRVVVVGLARSGEAACRLLLKQGAAVVGTDRRDEREIGDNLCSLEQDGVSLDLGEQYLRSLLSADLVVVSPGVDLREPLFARVREVGIPLIGEVELAYRYSEATFIGVTGTNGKSTTTTLLGLILKQAGLPAHVAGNIGTPLCRVAPSLSAGEYVVAELSSFQLETIGTFRPRVALLLNLAVVAADAGMVAAHDEVRAPVVLAGDRVPDGLLRPRIAHGRREHRHHRAVLRVVVLEQHL